jgi:photosystem II stability/assembly factor-like uncharacterized protein
MHVKVISVPKMMAIVLITANASGQPSWTPVSFPVQNITIDAIAIDSHDRMFAGTKGLGMYRSTNLGSSWDSVGLVYYNFNFIVFDSSDVTYAGTDLGLFRSDDHGGSWGRADSGITDKAVKALAINRSNVLFAGNENLSTRTGKILRSTDGGVNWEELKTVPNGGDELAVSRAGTILAAAGGIEYRSTDDGNTWNEIVGINSAVLCFACDSSGVIFAGGTGYLYGNLWMSSDEGLTWSITSNGLPREIGSICIDSVELMFAGIINGGGVWRSTDHAGSWIEINAGLGDKRITGLAISKDGYLFAATMSGIWQTVSPVTSLSETPRSVPNGFSLAQNYPNPFNPSTTIRYCLPHKSAVHLTVYNALGQQVATLVEGEKEAGYHEVQFDGKNLASGVYFYRLQAGDFVQTRRLVLIE